MTTDQSVINELVKALVYLLLGGGFGCLIGIRIGVKKTIKQTQKGGKDSTLSQVGVIVNGEH